MLPAPIGYFELGLCLCVNLRHRIGGELGFAQKSLEHSALQLTSQFPAQAGFYSMHVASSTDYSRREQGFAQKSLVSLSSSNPDCLTVLQLESAVRISQTHAVASAQKSVVPYWRCQWTLAAALVWPRRSCVRRVTRWLFRAAVEEINLIIGYRREGRRRLIVNFPI